MSTLRHLIEKLSDHTAKKKWVAVTKKMKILLGLPR